MDFRWASHNSPKWMFGFTKHGKKDGGHGRSAMCVHYMLSQLGSLVRSKSSILRTASYTFYPNKLLILHTQICCCYVYVHQLLSHLNFISNLTVIFVLCYHDISVTVYVYLDNLMATLTSYSLSTSSGSMYFF